MSLLMIDLLPTQETPTVLKEMRKLAWKISAL
jgi:hypothetical protein